MLQSPKTAARMAAIMVLTFLLAGFTAPAFASPAPTDSLVSVPVLVFAEAPILHVKEGSVETKTVDFVWDGLYHPVLASKPDGNGGIYFYNQIFLNGRALYGINRPCNVLNDVMGPWQQDIDLLDYLVKGKNHVTLEIRNTCGLTGNSDIYLTAYNMKVPPGFQASPPAATAPQPPAVTSPKPPVVQTPSAPKPPTPSGPSVPPSVPLPLPRIPDSLPNPACGSAYFFGVRGSGEKQSDSQGFGETVSAMLADLQLVTPELKSKAVHYRAIAVSPHKSSYSRDYVNSVEGGVQALLRDLRRFIRNCPHTYAILAGYSQGAEVVGVAYGRLTDEQRRHVAAVALFGNPRFNPAQTSVNRGDYSASFNGVDVSAWGDRKVTVPAGWEARVHDYCASGDPVCNYRLRNLPGCNALTAYLTCIHVQYPYLGYTDMGAVWARQMLGDMPHL